MSVAVASSLTDHNVANVLRAPARTATPAIPNAARLSPFAVSQALNTSNSMGCERLRSLVCNKLFNSLTSMRSSLPHLN